MKLMTEIRDGQCVSSQGWPMNKESEVTHDAAAAHALMREIANLREVSRKRGSGSGQLALNLLDVMERNADELMAEWGFDREGVE